MFSVGPARLLPRSTPAAAAAHAPLS